VSGVCILAVTFGLLYFQLTNVKNVYAAGPPYYSVADGEWSSSIWSTSQSASSSCGCNPGCNNNGPGITITNRITSSSCSVLKYSGGGNVTISGNGNLTIYTDFEINGGSTLNITNGDSVTVYGNFTISGGSHVNVTGGAVFKVNGNVTLSGNSNVCGPSGAGTINYTGSLTGSGWGGCTGSLPVELLYFKAKFNSDHVDFNWATATEVNNDYFTIERSQDGKDFEEVLRKPGAGSSTVQHSYSAIDDAPLHGMSYYRLKQTDYDGKFVYYPVKAVEYGSSERKSGESVSIKTIGPNPFTSNFNINYSTEAQSEVEIQISNSSGQLVYKETVTADKGFNTYSFNDQAGLPPGIYIVNMISNGMAVTKKLIKQ